MKINNKGSSNFVVNHVDGHRPSSEPQSAPGASGGGPFAVAAAAVDPQRVRAVGVVAGIGPWRELADPWTEPEERACLARLDEGNLVGARAGMRDLVENVW